LELLQGRDLCDSRDIRRAAENGGTEGFKEYLKNTYDYLIVRRETKTGAAMSDIDKDKQLHMLYESAFQRLAATYPISADNSAQFKTNASRGHYYNSDYYYVHEEFKSALNEVYSEIRSKYGLEPCEPPTVTGAQTYNDGLNLFLKIDPDAGPPPRGMEIYFQEEKYCKATEYTGGETYRFLAYDESPGAKIGGGTIYINLPKGVSLLKRAANFPLLSLFEIAFGNRDYVPYVQSYDISKLVSGYPGSNIFEKLESYITDNFVYKELEYGTVSVRYGGSTWNGDIPFEFNDKRTISSESTMEFNDYAPDSPEMEYLKYFSFRRQ
jgi:hypothetical protein